MSQPNNYNKLYKKADMKSLYATLLLLVNIVIIFFVTSGFYSTYTEKTEETVSQNEKIQALTAELKELKAKKDKFKNDEGLLKTLTQLAGKYREDLILNQIYSKNEGITVHDISMDKGQKLPNGLKMANITITLDAKSVGALNKYTDMLTSKENDVRFIIKDISVPLNTENLNSSLSTSLSLGMYYYEKQ